MRITIRETMFGFLVLAIVMEAIDICFVNISTPSEANYFDIDSSLSHFVPPNEPPKVKESRRRVVFLVGSDKHSRRRINTVYFDSKIGRQVEWHKNQDANSTYYETQRVDVLRNPVTLAGRDGGETGLCQPAAKWQTKFYPTCNAFHELDMRFKNRRKRPEGTVLKLFGVGTSRDAWRVKTAPRKVVVRRNQTTSFRQTKMDGVILKTLQMSRDFSQLSYHFQILDAIASERLSSSPYTTDIYGFCGFSVLNEAGHQLDLEESQTRIERLRYARDLAAGLADAHDGSSNRHVNATEAKAAKMVHADLRHSNVLISNDERKTLKLSDFNQGYFLGWNPKTKEPCGYRPNFTFWNDRFAAPEECLGKVQTEKTDVYHLGGMIFYFLTGYKPYTFNLEDYHHKQQLWNSSKKWTVPVLPKRLEDAIHPANIVMKKAMKWCLRFKTSQRPTARQVFQMLNQTLAEVEDWEE